MLEVAVAEFITDQAVLAGQAVVAMQDLLQVQTQVMQAHQIPAVEVAVELEAVAVLHQADLVLFY
jgi:hypothetical protein